MAIFTVTLNPAIDLETTVPIVEPGEKLRCSDPLRDPGGGGINVARAIVQLGGAATALVAMQGQGQGQGGDDLARLLAGQSVPVLPVPAPGPPRQNLSVREALTGRQFRFVFPGPVWAAPDLTRAAEAIAQPVAAGDWVVLSGSMPPGVTPADYADLARRLAECGGRVVVDTSGAALAEFAARPVGLALLRMDRAEADELAGRALTDATDSADFAAALVAQGVARLVIVARGAEGSVLAEATGRWFAPVARVPIVSRTGAGDSFVAGAVLALSRHQPLAEVVQWGSAAASAAVMTPGTDLCKASDVARLIGQCEARKI